MEPNSVETEPPKKKKFELLSDGSMIFRTEDKEYKIPEVKPKEARDLYRKTEAKLKANRRSAAEGIAPEFERIKKVSPEMAELLVKEAVADAKKSKVATDALKSTEVADYLNSMDGVVFWMGDIFRRSYPNITDEEVYDVLMETSEESAELLKKEMEIMWREAADQGKLPQFGAFAVRDRLTKKALKTMVGGK